MIRRSFSLAAALVLCPSLQAAQIQREFGDYALELGTRASRSMAQGVISPSPAGAFHGGLDVAHSSGWYMGQYAPSLGLSETSTLRLDSYLGYKRRFDDSLGLEAGLIHYSQPNLASSDSYAVYAGVSAFGSRFGSAWRDNPDNRTSTLFASLDELPWGVDLTVKLAHHQLGTPFVVGDGSEVQAFNDWAVQLSRPWLGIDLDLVYSSSDLQGGGCAAYSGINAYCQSMLTFKLQRSFF